MDWTDLDGLVLVVLIIHASDFVPFFGAEGGIEGRIA